MLLFVDDSEVLGSSVLLGDMNCLALSGVLNDVGLISTSISHFYHVVHDLPIDDFIPDENVLECYEVCPAGR